MAAASTDDDLRSLLPASSVIGTIRVRHPTLYIFTGGNEDAAFLSIYGFNLLLDGGDQKEIAYWNFIKNYDKVNAVLSSRPSPECLRGISTILARKAIEQCHPKIGAFLGNLPPRSACTGESEAAKAILSIYEGLQAEGIKPYEVYTHPKMEPVTLYEVIGEGSLRMIVLNPERSAKDMAALAGAIKTGDNAEKLSMLTGLAVVLIWQPYDSSKSTIRILYPGACPLEKLYAALEKLKGEECLRHVEFVSADREKYSSNLSLNTRGASRRSAPQARTPTSTLRTNMKPAPAASPRTIAPPKPVGPPVPKPAPKTTTRSEPKPRVAAEHGPPRAAGGAIKKTTHSTTAAAPSTRTAGKPAKPTADSKSPAAGIAKKDHVKTSNGKPPVIPRKSSNHAEEKKKEVKKEHAAPEAHFATAAALTAEERKSDKKAATDKSEPKPEDFTAGPQAPDSSGLLDGIEEPVKLHLVSMDTNGNNPPLGAQAVDTSSSTQHNGTPEEAISKEEHKLIDFTAEEIPPVSIGLSNLIAAESLAQAHQAVSNDGSNIAHYPVEGIYAGDAPLESMAEVEKKEVHIEALGGIGQADPGHDTDSSYMKNVPSGAGDLPATEQKAKQNGSAADALKAQEAMEDADAREQHLPPVAATSRPQAKKTVGLVTKPKLSQPLYFDVVFVPHHGAHPTLQDEAAAKAFAISVRSKRYVLSGRDAEKTHILDGFIAAKNVWNKPELEFDILPTYSSDSLHLFNNTKTGEMIEAGMNLRCAVDRCTVRLSNGSEAEECCPAFKFEL